MSDLIERLRGPCPSIPAMRDAANEIERLTAERNALRDDNAKLNGWMEEEAQAAGRLQRKLNAAEEEIDHLTAALWHEADCVEAAKAEIERLQIGIELFDAADADLRTKLDAANDLAEMIASERDELRRQLAEADKSIAHLQDALRVAVNAATGVNDV